MPTAATSRAGALPGMVKASATKSSANWRVTGAGRYTSSSVTDVRWLPPTSANIAQTLVTIPPGSHEVGSPADQ